MIAPPVLPLLVWCTMLDPDLPEKDLRDCIEPVVVCCDKVCHPCDEPNTRDDDETKEDPDAQ